MDTTDHKALHAHLLNLLGAKDHEDAARIIGEHHARELREREVGMDAVACIDFRLIGLPRIVWFKQPKGRLGKLDVYAYPLLAAQDKREREVGGAVTDDVLVCQLRGRAQFLRDAGRIKSPELMERAASALESFAARRAAMPDADAARWRAARNNTGDGIRIVLWNHKQPDELQVMFPSPTLCDSYADAAMLAAAPEVKPQGDAHG